MKNKLSSRRFFMMLVCMLLCILLTTFTIVAFFIHPEYFNSFATYSMPVSLAILTPIISWIIGETYLKAKRKEENKPSNFDSIQSNESK